MIKKVRKVRIIVPKEKKEELLINLQREELVMLPMHENNGFVDVSYEEEIISRTTNAIKKLSAHNKKNRKFFQYDTVKFDEFISNSESKVAVLGEIENKFDRLNFLESEIKENERLIKEVSAFKNLKYTTKQLSESKYVTFLFGYVPLQRWDFFQSYCQKDNCLYFEFEENELGKNILVVLDNDLVDKQQNQLKRFGFVNLELPILDRSIKDYMESLTKFHETTLTNITNIKKELSEDNKSELELKILADQMQTQITRKLIKYKEDSKDVIFDAWISAEKEEQLQAVVKEVTLEYQLEFEEPTSFDNTPTLLQNNKFVQPFESITNMYAAPSYTEVDPNPLMSIWYWIIFGLVMGDVGYGSLMFILFGLILKFKKPKGDFGDLVKIMFLSSIPAILSGFVFSSAFGASLGYKPLLDPLDDPIKMLIFSLGIGVLHLSSGLIMKIINSFKQKRYYEGLASGLSWLLILLGGSLFAINMGLKLTTSALKITSIVIVILGFATMYIFTGLQKKSIFGKLFGGLSGITDITNYLSDILSYSRILALVLSTSIIGFTMNLLAGLIQGSVIGFILSIFVYIIGHIFNLAMGLLSAYVHTGRLQYLEFYGKFYEGGGYLFEPLKFETKYINEIVK